MDQPRSAYGGDRIAGAPDGTFAISCRVGKGWVARHPEQGLRKPFPGTCVRWDGVLFEVLSSEELPVGIRYRLAPWDETHVIRVIEDYDAASEQARAASRRDAAVRERKRTLSVWLALVAGLLPAEVQDEMESELGIRASRMTIVSTIPLFALGGTCLILLAAAMFGAGTPTLGMAAGTYFFFESLVRFAIAAATGRPIGSIVLLVPWTILQAIRNRNRPGPALPPLPPDPSVIERDAYRVREPFLALLSADDQRQLEMRYGFDPVAWGKRTAALLLLFALIGIASGATAEGGPSISVLLTAGYLAAEQLVRLLTLARGLPAGSIFGIVIRPLARPLLRHPP